MHTAQGDVFKLLVSCEQQTKNPKIFNLKWNKTEKQQVHIGEAGTRKCLKFIKIKNRLPDWLLVARCAKLVRDDQIQKFSGYTFLCYQQRQAQHTVLRKMQFVLQVF